MSIDIEKVRARAEAATPGPWGTQERQSVYIPFPWGGVKAHVETDANAEFIAHAREDVPALLDEVERQERAVEALVRIRNQQATRAEKAEAERDRLQERESDLILRWREAEDALARQTPLTVRLQAAVEAVRAKVTHPGFNDYPDPAAQVHAALDEHLGGSDGR